MTDGTTRVTSTVTASAARYTSGLISQRRTLIIVLNRTPPARC